MVGSDQKRGCSTNLRSLPKYSEGFFALGGDYVPDIKDVGKAAGGPRKFASRAARRAKLIDKVLKGFEKNFDPKTLSIGELIKLLQLEKELRGEEAKDIKVTWVEPKKTTSSEE
jgi:hypothetical protein